MGDTTVVDDQRFDRRRERQASRAVAKRSPKARSPAALARTSALRRLKKSAAVFKDLNARGLRRLYGHKSALEPDRLEVAFQGDGSALAEGQRLGLDELDRLSAAGGGLDLLITGRSGEIAGIVDAETAFALAVEQHTTRDRFRAIVARAYARAWRFADVVAERRAAEGEAGLLADQLHDAMQILGVQGASWSAPDAARPWERTQLCAMLCTFEKLILEKDDKREDRRSLLRHALEDIDRIRQALSDRAGKAGEPGRPINEEIFYLAVCLGEAFVILTGLRPIFDRTLRKRHGAPLNWLSFLDAAFRACGLGIAVPTATLVRLRDAPDGWDGYFRGLSREFSSQEMTRRLENPHDSRRFNFGQLLSIGVELDYQTDLGRALSLDVEGVDAFC